MRFLVISDISDYSPISEPNPGFSQRWVDDRD